MVVHILPLILSAIGPSKETITIHFVLVPVAVVSAAIFPCVGAFTMDVVFVELTVELITIVPLEASLAVLKAIDIASNVGGTIGPDLLALSMLLVLHPFPFVAGPVRMRVNTQSIGHVILPLAFVDIAIRMNKSAASLSFITLEPAFVDRAILEYLLSFAFSHHGARDPLALILHLILRYLLRAVFKLLLATV